MKNKKWRRTTLIIFVLLVFLLGLGFARLKPESIYLVYTAAFCWIITLIISRRTINAFVVVSIALSFTLGWWRGTIYMQKVSVYNSLFGREVNIEAIATEDAVYSDKSQLTFAADHLRVQTPFQQNLVGQIQVAGFGVPMIYRGDHVRVYGKLFPRRGSNQAGISFAVISLVAHKNSKLENLRHNFNAGLQNVLPEQFASFALGLLIGQRSTLNKTITDELVVVGLIHIVAVSGYNLTIITSASQRAFKKRSRYQAVVTSLLLISIFLLFTGFSASITRAAIVSTIGLFMWYFGRKVRPVLLILIAASLTAGLNPLYLWSNVGWYLSFTAFFGVLVLAPLVKKRFMKSNSDKIIINTLLETTAAQFCTLPLLLFVFGRLSLVSVVANLLVVPLVPLAMLLSLLAGIGGMTHFAFAGLISLPTRWLLTYMISIAHTLSALPFASTKIQINAWQMVMTYCFITFVTFLLYMAPKQRKHVKISGDLRSS